MATVPAGTRDLQKDAAELRRAVPALARAITLQERGTAARYNLSPSQSAALGILAARGPISLNALAGDLMLDKSTVSRVADALVRQGYVSRRDNPASRRSILLDVTAPGRALRRRIEEELVTWTARLLEGADPELRGAAIELLTELGARAQESPADL